MFKKLLEVFKVNLNQNEKLIKNLEAYEQKEREKQSQAGNSKRDKPFRQKIEKV